MALSFQTCGMALGQKTVIENGTVPSLSENWDGIVRSCHIGAVMFTLVYACVCVCARWWNTCG